MTLDLLLWDSGEDCFEEGHSTEGAGRTVLVWVPLAPLLPSALPWREGARLCRVVGANCTAVGVEKQQTREQRAGSWFLGAERQCSVTAELPPPAFAYLKLQPVVRLRCCLVAVYL